MVSWFPLVQQRAQEVAETVAESCDTAYAAPALARLIRGVSSRGETEPASPDPLRQLGLDDTTISRLVRGVMFNAIQLIRDEADPSEVPEAVLTLRSYLAGAVVLPPVNPAEREYFRRLMQNEKILDEPEYEQLQDLIHNVVHSINDVIYIHDLNGMFLYINRAGLELTGFSMEEVLSGISIYDLIAPEFLEMIEARLEMPGAVARAPYSAEIYTKQGMRIAVELSTQVLRRKGRDSIIIGLASDLRLARRLESEIWRANAHLDTILSHAPLGVFTLDGTGMVQDANPAAVQLFGAPSAGALVGEPFLTLFIEPPEDLNKKISLAIDGLKVQQRLAAETVFGGTLICDMWMLPVADQGEAESILVLLSDLSVQTTLRQNILQREKLTSLGEVMAGVAHQISTPLTVVIGYAQTLLANDPPESDKRRLEQILQEATRCRQVMQNLIKFSQPRATGMSYFSLNDLLEQVVSLREYQMANNGIKILKSYENNLPPVHGDENELQRVFLNILLNAQQALALVTEHEKTLEISTSKDVAGRISVKFSDNGPGMSEAIQTRAFDPFFTTKGPDAAGLGLSTARGIVRDHGGDVWIQSAEGDGTELTVIIPPKG